jgi:hypothetical protein
VAWGVHQLVHVNAREHQRIGTPMARCDTCGNEYERSFEVTLDGRAYTFDSFECAIHRLAPVCESCGCRMLGHGVQSDEQMFCSAHCARQRGVRGITDHVGGHVVIST